ncbi:4-hydroxybenzoate octaprenyltransferase [Glaciecola siphonariae]|uniref:4-hydroxybenzoate octaprenyltransferase n=1 Tax=Glaciecola siphonariae TaxID=521012 RepID=A0ABV9LWX9_9ALTE
MIALSWKNRRAYWQLMRMDKPIGIYLLLWPTVWALLLSANGLPQWHITLVFILGVVLMRSAGCVINDYADRHVDGAVTRTKHRPLASGQATEKEAKQLFGLLVLLSFLLVLSLNWQTIALSLVAVALASLYPFMKRYTHLPQVVLGLAFSWSMPMAAMAILGSIPYWIWLLYAANVCWTVAYDTQYAMVDRKDDLKVGIKSTAILFGKYDLIVIAALQALTVVLLAAVFDILELNMLAYLGLNVAAVLFALQHVKTRGREEAKCFAAFLNNHWVGLAVACGIVAALLPN